MRQKIYGIFSNVDDAKQAFGRIKKASLNQADLTIVFADNRENHVTKGNNNYEFAAENFGESLKDTAHTRTSIWPGLQTENLSGIGKIQIGSSNNQKIADSVDHDRAIQLVGDDLAIIAQQVKANKVVTIIEAEAELVPQVRLILESNGAEIISKPE